MKRIVMALLMAAVVISLTACGQNAGQNGNSSSDTMDKEQSSAPAEESASVYDVIFLGFPIWLAYHNLIQCTQA